MKRFNNLVKLVTLVSLAVSFVCFGIAAIGSLFDSSISMVFWYLGLTGLWIMLAAAVVSITVFLIDFGQKLMQKQLHRSERNSHYLPHAVA